MSDVATGTPGGDDNAQVVVAQGERATKPKKSTPRNPARSPPKTNPKSGRMENGSTTSKKVGKRPGQQLPKETSVRRESAEVSTRRVRPKPANGAGADTGQSRPKSAVGASKAAGAKSTKTTRPASASSKKGDSPATESNRKSKVAGDKQISKFSTKVEARTDSGLTRPATAKVSASKDTKDKVRRRVPNSGTDGNTRTNRPVSRRLSAIPLDALPKAKPKKSTSARTDSGLKPRRRSSSGTKPNPPKRNPIRDEVCDKVHPELRCFEDEDDSMASAEYGDHKVRSEVVDHQADISQPGGDLIKNEPLEENVATSNGADEDAHLSKILKEQEAELSPEENNAVSEKQNYTSRRVEGAMRSVSPQEKVEVLNSANEESGSCGDTATQSPESNKPVASVPLLCLTPSAGIEDSENRANHNGLVKVELPYDEGNEPPLVTEYKPVDYSTDEDYEEVDRGTPSFNPPVVTISGLAGGESIVDEESEAPPIPPKPRSAAHQHRALPPVPRNIVVDNGSDSENCEDYEIPTSPISHSGHSEAASTFPDHDFDGSFEETYESCDIYAAIDEFRKADDSSPPPVPARTHTMQENQPEKSNDEVQKRHWLPKLRLGKHGK
eukprot:m.462544 g.462544  ORF g.462544 m.462544 type:complete len:611 (-) comp22701_c0_seq1:11-1843(-)